MLFHIQHRGINCKAIGLHDSLTPFTNKSSPRHVTNGLVHVQAIVACTPSCLSLDCPDSLDSIADIVAEAVLPLSGACTPVCPSSLDLICVAADVDKPDLNRNCCVNCRLPALVSNSKAGL